MSHPSFAAQFRLVVCLVGFTLTSFLCGYPSDAFVKQAQAEEKAVGTDSVPAREIYECRWASEALAIDGRADEPAWQRSEVIDNFQMAWLAAAARPARRATQARLLWDEKFLYFHAEMDDTDLYADVTEHDGQTWDNDVFELFFKPHDEGFGYYEFQINAANTQFDAFFPARGAGSVRRFKSADTFHIESAVVLRGTLNDYQDQDRGWSVEGRIPWSDFAHTGGRPQAGTQWKFTLCRYDYSVEYESPELSAIAPLKRLDFHRYEDYVPLEFVGPR